MCKRLAFPLSGHKPHFAVLCGAIKTREELRQAFLYILAQKINGSIWE